MVSPVSSQSSERHIPQAQTGDAVCYPARVSHWLNDAETLSQSGAAFPKFNPATGQVLAQVTRGNHADAEQAVALAERCF